jgi:hypothetical protein
MRVLPPISVAAPIPSTPASVATPIAGRVIVIPGAHHWWRCVGGSAWRHDNNGRSCRGRCPITSVVVQRSARGRANNRNFHRDGCSSIDRELPSGPPSGAAFLRSSRQLERARPLEPGSQKCDARPSACAFPYRRREGAGRILRNVLKNFRACLNAAPTAMASYF